jgi:hypothetical protein
MASTMAWEADLVAVWDLMARATPKIAEQTKVRIKLKND